MALKFNVINENVQDKRVVVIDDSIVRGNTTGPLIKLLRNAGAREVHMAITCPPISHPCFMGVDMGRHEDLIAYQRTVDEIRELVGADSLHYLSVDGMMRALKRTDGFCQACFTGQYPIPVDLSNVKTGFERVTKGNGCETDKRIETDGSYECVDHWFGWAGTCDYVEGVSIAKSGEGFCVAWQSWDKSDCNEC